MKLWEKTEENTEFGGFRLILLGVLAQMVEHMLCKYKVAGSMPVNSTGRA